MLTRRALPLALALAACAHAPTRHDAITAIAQADRALRAAHATLLAYDAARLKVIAVVAVNREEAERFAAQHDAQMQPVRAALAAAFTTLALAAGEVAAGTCEPAECAVRAAGVVLQVQRAMRAAGVALAESDAGQGATP